MTGNNIFDWSKFKIQNSAVFNVWAQKKHAQKDKKIHKNTEKLYCHLNNITISNDTAVCALI